VDKSTSSCCPVSWIYLVVSVVALAIFGVGLYLALMNPHEWAMLAAGCLSLVGVGVTWPIAQILAYAQANHAVTQQTAHALGERLDQMSSLLNRVSEQQMLSDRAKSVAFRDQDRAAIRRALNEELAQGEWEAAFALVDQFEKAFGSKAEADRLRADINERQNAGVKETIAQAMTVIDRHTRAEEWSAALREAEKLIAQYSEHAEVKHLPLEIENRRQARKKELLMSWHEAVARHDVDGSIEILRQLDPYLTPTEAESMQDTARGVFKEKLNNLGADFAAAIREHRWNEALRIGQQIQSDFPNSRIAQEVREKMETLRQRASEPAGAAS